MWGKGRITVCTEVKTSSQRQKNSRSTSVCRSKVQRQGRQKSGREALPEPVSRAEDTREANSLRIWRRDRRRHASPNSAQTESAAAGALGIQLAGPAYYFGELHDKPTIGDAQREIVPQDILRINRMLYAASFLSFAIFAGLRILWILL